MKDVRARLLALSRAKKRVIQVFVDTVLIWVTLWAAFVVRLGLDEMVNPVQQHFWLFVAAPLIAIPLFIRFGMYRAVMRYFGSDALVTIVKAVTLSSLILALYVFWYSNHQNLVPRSIVFNYWWLSLIAVGGVRLGMRQYFMGDWFAGANYVPFASRDDGLVKVAIYGAGAAGNQLVAALRMGKLMRPVAFIDDDIDIEDRVISGLHVYRAVDIPKMVEATGAQEILLAIPSASRARRREILSYLEQFPLHVRSVPSVLDLASGRVQVDDIQEVDIADLLGRDVVAAQVELMERCIKNKVVMITGAGGSIGSELCRQALELQPKTLVLYDSSEFNLYNILSDLERQLERSALDVRIISLLGSVSHSERLLRIMQQWRVDTVYHAAAYKHVPIVEHNISQGVLNNVFGTLSAVKAAIKANVSSFVLVSTDKAVRPTNVMGSTKRLAELILQALSAEKYISSLGGQEKIHNTTRVTMVRFGNVLGSSGSVIPLFHRQIKAGGPITVTHPKVTRYFMTIPEAAQLVIQAGSMGGGGDVFVLDMGEPVKIVDLARKMIHLSGLSVKNSDKDHGDIEIKFSGLRPGEKLYEELLIGDNVVTTRHPMIMRAVEDYIPWDDLKVKLQSLQEALDGEDLVRVRQLLRDTVVGYLPNEDIVDFMYRDNINDRDDCL
ncbi:polysaccharide biosynthesis protein [Pseudomonas asiatica]|uniref:Polysaccharide biosynthesis protein n=1 Tax=Pseudomonas asiatica TaxID=2219225 RepID=A0A9X4HXS6_9PSED|nr:nucleoside-diphosphate sugar epimerase/dehydratase [Pseudomonas asiatica]MDD2109854.1 polysaccharide biosynthesis protein [Pseudomonas asiatica]